MMGENINGGYNTIGTGLRSWQILSTATNQNYGPIHMDAGAGSGVRHTPPCYTNGGCSSCQQGMTVTSNAPVYMVPAQNQAPASAPATFVQPNAQRMVPVSNGSYNNGNYNNGGYNGSQGHFENRNGVIYYRSNYAPTEDSVKKTPGYIRAEQNAKELQGVGFDEPRPARSAYAGRTAQEVNAVSKESALFPSVNGTSNDVEGQWVSARQGQTTSASRSVSMVPVSNLRRVSNPEVIATPAPRAVSNTSVLPPTQVTNAAPMVQSTQPVQSAPQVQSVQMAPAQQVMAQPQSTVVYDNSAVPMEMTSGAVVGGDCGVPCGDCCVPCGPVCGPVCGPECGPCCGPICGGCGWGGCGGCGLIPGAFRLVGRVAYGAGALVARVGNVAGFGVQSAVHGAGLAVTGAGHLAAGAVVGTGRVAAGTTRAVVNNVRTAGQIFWFGVPYGPAYGVPYDGVPYGGAVVPAAVGTAGCASCCGGVTVASNPGTVPQGDLLYMENDSYLQMNPSGQAQYSANAGNAYAANSAAANGAVAANTSPNAMFQNPAPTANLLSMQPQYVKLADGTEVVLQHDAATTTPYSQVSYASANVPAPAVQQAAAQQTAPGMPVVNQLTEDGCKIVAVENPKIELAPGEVIVSQQDFVLTAPENAPASTTIVPASTAPAVAPQSTVMPEPVVNSSVSPEDKTVQWKRPTGAFQPVSYTQPAEAPMSGATSLNGASLNWGSAAE